MLCRNCNYILSGTEDFCPHCGQATKTQEAETTQENEGISLNSANPHTANKGSSIFDIESAENEDEAPKKSKGKNKAAVTLVSMLVFILIVIALFTAADYFDLAPAISSFISKQVTATDETKDTLTTQGELNGTEGMLPPQINYKPITCTVTSQKPLPLRKGPGDTYAPIGTVPYGTRLQITGGCNENDIWVYVYIPSEDAYGWLSASFLASEASLESTTLPEREEEAESTTAKSTQKNEESQQTLSQSSYKAKVTAEKGLYLRVGPGTDFEALQVIGKDEEITVIEICKSNPQWVYVDFHGEKGYVSSSYVSKT